MTKFREESNQMYSNKSAVISDMEKISRNLPKINKDMQLIKDKLRQLEESETANKTHFKGLQLNLANKLDIAYK